MYACMHVWVFSAVKKIENRNEKMQLYFSRIIKIIIKIMYLHDKMQSRCKTSKTVSN